jgi:anti-sigma-K factor RskA
LLTLTPVSLSARPPQQTEEESKSRIPMEPRNSIDCTIEEKAEFSCSVENSASRNHKLCTDTDFWRIGYGTSALQ